MKGFVVVGTDTNAGKTSFSLLVLAAFPEQLTYWKPVETGDSDTDKVRRLLPHVRVCEPLARFREPVAPALAARRDNRRMPTIEDILHAKPETIAPVVIETFGGPLSPLTDDCLQVELIRAWDLPIVLVSSSRVGAIGRVLSTVHAMDVHGVRPAAIALLGAEDHYAQQQIEHYCPGIPVVGVNLPDGEWTCESLMAMAATQRDRLRAVQTLPERATTSNAARFSDSACVWHPYTPIQTPDAPLPVVAAHNEFLMLADGRTVIDGISSWWTILHGHRQPAIMQAIRNATHRLDHVLFAGATHPHAVELAGALLETMPWAPGGRVFYSDNGSTAVEVALKLAYQYWCHHDQPRRTLFIGFEHGYHGDTFGAMSVSRDPIFFGRFEPLLFRVVQSPLDPDRLNDLLSQHRESVAAVILEPLVQGAGGMRIHSPQLLKSLYRVIRDHDVLFIADEVMTGFGRTGSLWAFEQGEVLPDLVCLAKGITGGVLPLAATIAAPSIVAAFNTADRSRTFYHGHSFTANPIACAAAVASWNRLQSGQWKTDVERIAAFWSARLRSFAECPGVQAVRTCGLIMAVELDVPGGYLAEAGRVMRNASLEHDVLLRPLGNVLYALPPFCISNESLDKIAAAMTHALRCTLA